MPLRPIDRSLGARSANARRWARLARAERAVAMAPAREAAEARFMEQARAMYPGLAERELGDVAAEMRATWYAEVTAKARAAYRRRLAERIDTGGPGRAMPGPSAPRGAGDE